MTDHRVPNNWDSTHIQITDSQKLGIQELIFTSQSPKSGIQLISISQSPTIGIQLIYVQRKLRANCKKTKDGFPQRRAGICLQILKWFSENPNKDNPYNCCLFSTKVFKVIHKIRQSAILVDLFTSPAVCPCDCSWSATENSHFAHIAVFLLDKSKESRHIRSAKMVARF